MAAAITYRIDAGRVFDGTGAPSLENGTVLIEKGKVVYVGPREQAPVREDAQTIELPDATLMPGLIDGDTGINGDLGTVNLLRHYLHYGVTTVVTFNGISPGKRPAKELQAAIEKGVLGGCARLIVGHVVGATNGHNRGRTADGPWEVRRAVRASAEAGANFIKTTATGGFVDTADGEGVHTLNYTAEELNALIDEAHAWGLTVSVHAHSQPGIGRVLDAGADRLMHGCLIDEAAIERMAKQGTWWIPTLRITSHDNMAAFAQGVRTKKEQSNIIHREGVRRALAAGVRLALGSHGPGPAALWKPGESTSVELGELVSCGMTPVQALCAATQQAAKAYGIDRRVGTLAPGKDADLVCVLGDPTRDIGLLRDPSRIKLVFVKGRIEHAQGDVRFAI